MLMAALKGKDLASTCQIGPREPPASLSLQLMNENADVAGVDSAAYPSSETPTATNYFLQYISSG